MTKEVAPTDRDRAGKKDVARTERGRAEKVAVMRAADADRQEIAARLHAALEEGRLNLGEYDDRLGRAYAAQTYADLLHLVDDLPQPGLKATEVRAREAAEARRAARRLPTALIVLWTIWGAVGALNVAIWALVLASTQGDHAIYPWPLWVIVPPGAALLAVTIGTQEIRRRRT